MRVSDLVSSSVKSLLRTKSRSLLTMLGIVIGITSVILVLSIGQAAQQFIINQISTFGSDVLTISNGPREPAGNSTPSLFVKESLTVKDALALKAQPWVRLATASNSQADTVIANGVERSVTIVGTTADEERLYDLRLAKGAFFAPEDVESHANVVVLGADTARTSFGQENAVGKNIKIGGKNFRVVGVMVVLGTRSFQDLDKRVYIPVTSLADLSNRKYVSSISIKTDITLSEATRRIEDVLRDKHDITTPSEDDFHVLTQEDAIESTKQITGILQILLASIAAISLIVGGIGIMNIMYVSVTERIREIGLRKSIGATRIDILSQFLTEAVFLTTLGGVIGVLLGISLTWLAIQAILQFQSGWSFVVSVPGILLGLIVSMVIGIIFGFAPARRAAALRPMEALRHE